MTHISYLILVSNDLICLKCTTERNYQDQIHLQYLTMPKAQFKMIRFFSIINHKGFFHQLSHYHLVWGSMCLVVIGLPAQSRTEIRPAPKSRPVQDSNWVQESWSQTSSSWRSHPSVGRNWRKESFDDRWQEG